MKQFYVYVLSRPDGSPFYVGKGHGNRHAEFSKSRNTHFKSIVAKYGASNIAYSLTPCDSESDAFSLEIQTILALKMAGEKLANATDGGEGASGRASSDQTRKKMSYSAKLRGSHPNSLAALAEFSRTNETLTEAHKAKISASHIGIGHTDETKEKMRLAKLGGKQTDEHRANNRAANKGRKLTPEHIAKVKAAHTGLVRNQEIKDKMKEAWRLRKIKYGPTGQSNQAIV